MRHTRKIGWMTNTLKAPPDRARRKWITPAENQREHGRCRGPGDVSVSPVYAERVLMGSNTFALRYGCSYAGKGVVRYAW
jgi:hypothetical protein